MYTFKYLISEEVLVGISGNTVFSGILIDVGLDVIVLYNGSKYQYIPLLHVHYIKNKKKDPINVEPTPKPSDLMPFQIGNESISYRKILLNAKGQFVEIFITGNKSVHGYITNVLNDFIIFFSPVYKTMFISMEHLKWLTPYTSNLTPYTLSKTLLPVVPSTVPNARTFAEQIKKYEGQLLVFDMGDQPEKIGLLSNLSDNIAELVTAEGLKVYWNLVHLKSVHIP